MSDTLFKRVTRDSFIALFWQVAGGACLFIFHTLLTRHLNMDDYGRVSYVISIVAFLGMMAPLGLSQTSMRFASVYFETSDWKALKGFVHYSIVVSFLAGLAMAIIMFGLAGRFLAIYSDPLRIAVWAIPAIGLTLTLGGILRGLRRIGKATFLITVLAQGILAIAIGISVVSKSNLGVSRVVIFYLTAYLGAAGIGLLWMLRGGLSSEYAAARADFSSTKWLTVSLPILVSVMMVQVFQRSDLLILGGLSTPSEVALYSAASRFTVITALVQNAVAMSTSPALAALHHESRNTELQDIVGKTSAVTGVVGIGTFLAILAFGKLLLSIFGEQYVSAMLILVILSFAQMFNAFSGLNGVLLTMTGHERIHAKITASSAVLNVIGHFMFIPRYGSMGAAMVTAATTVFWNVCMTWCVWRRMGIVTFMMPSAVKKIWCKKKL